MTIKHDNNNNRFVIELNGLIAYVEYQQNNKIFDITHTQVPTELAGKGLAGKLVEAAFEYAQKQNLDFKPTCSYAQVWLTRHNSQ